MSIFARFMRLNIWNKLAALSAVISIAAFVASPFRSKAPADQPNTASVNSSPGTIIVQAGGIVNAAQTFRSTEAAPPAEASAGPRQAPDTVSHQSRSQAMTVEPDQMASSVKSVGEFWLGELPKRVI